MFPTNTLKNYHLLRDRYYCPQMKTLEKKRGVAPGPLCSRYYSLGPFVQFLREDQIYAGLTRDDIVQVEYTLSDFTKELNPLMRQWKIDVYKNKVRNLLTPSHFICYGTTNIFRNHFEKLTV